MSRTPELSSGKAISSLGFLRDDDRPGVKLAAVFYAVVKKFLVSDGSWSVSAKVMNFRDGFVIIVYCVIGS